jgi:hypothetical protein
MIRFKNYVATGVAPNGRLYAGDLLLMQDLVAALQDFTQTVDLGTLRVGESGLQLLRYGAGEARLTGKFRVDGIFRALGGYIPPTMTTTQRDALAVGLAPYGLHILNTTTNKVQWNTGTDTARVWKDADGSSIWSPLLPTADEKAAMVGSFGHPDATNKFVTEDDPIFSIGPGWTGSAGTWAFISADAPTFVMRATGDFTAEVTPGTRVKLTQSTVKYFIVTAVSFSGGNTTVTMFGGTDYTLTSAAITLPSFSGLKAPNGFPIDPNKWKVELRSTSSRGFSATGVWQNKETLVVPIGIWNVLVQAQLLVGGNVQSGHQGFNVTLSDAATTESDSDFTMRMYGDPRTGPDESWSVEASLSRQKAITVPTKATYYLNVKAETLGEGKIQGSPPTIIRAVSAYL